MPFGDDVTPEAVRAYKAALRETNAARVAFQSAFDALLASVGRSAEARKIRATALAPHYRSQGGLSDQAAAGAFAALGVDLMALCDYQQWDEAA